MKQELIAPYEELEKMFVNMAKAQDKVYASLPTDGKRMRIPLKGREIEVVYYKADKKNAPVIFGAYGGGFIMGGCAYDNLLWKTISKEYECNVISIGYRKAPDYRFPCALHDVYNTICYFMEHAWEFDFDKEKAMTFGSSAGANLATAAALLDRQKGTNYIKTQILNYPYLDLATDPEEKGHGDQELLMYYLFPDQYVNDKTELKNPLVSPVYAAQEELSGMPKTIIVCGENDRLHIEGEKYADMLKESGVEVYCQTFSGMEHGFIEFYFYHQYTTIDQSFGTDRMKEDFKSGKLSETAKSAIRFIKAHL